MHSGYDKVTFDSDIALLKLSQPVTYTDYIVPSEWILKEKNM